MNTLIIHPSDPSTSFLIWSYSGLGFTRISEASHSHIRSAIRSHDIIIMMGHGTPLGLLNKTQNGYTIDSRMVQELRPKTCIGVWCHADAFFTKYGLSGPSTGMIISESYQK